MPSNSAEYQRSYRARRKAFKTSGGPPISGSITPNEGDPIEFQGTATEVIQQLSDRIMVLAEEVARLKRLLALANSGNQPQPYIMKPEANPFIEFRPAPKPTSRHR